MSATQPVEAPGADPETLPTGQDASLHFAVDRSDVQLPDPTDRTLTSGSSDVLSPDPTGHSATAKKRSSTVTGPTVPVEEPASEAGSVRASSIADEGEVSDLESTGPDQDELLDGDQELSAKQSYRETLRGVRSFMSWNEIPELDSASSSQDDNPFTGTRTSQTGKVYVKVPVDDWLCRKFEKLNLTVQVGYPTRNSETAGLSKDQFIKPPKTLKWYVMHAEKKDFFRSKVYTWTNEPARLNSSFPHVANRSLPSAPTSRPVLQETLRKWERAAHDQSYMCKVSQETLRKWERAARDQSYMCNQAAAFNRCLRYRKTWSTN